MAALLTRDVVVVGSCHAKKAGVAAMGAKVTVGDECWEHVHPDMYNVYDFSYWSTGHPGNVAAMKGGRPNPITGRADTAHSSLTFPAHHAMERWKLGSRFCTKNGISGGTSQASLP